MRRRVAAEPHGARVRLGETHGAAKEEFEAPHAKISGRSEGYRPIPEPVGDDFSDLIGGGLRELAEKNQAFWQDAPMACTHAFGGARQSRHGRDWYEREIAKLKTQLTSALNTVPAMGQGDFAPVRGARQPPSSPRRAPCGPRSRRAARRPRTSTRPVRGPTTRCRPATTSCSPAPCRPRGQVDARRSRPGDLPPGDGAAGQGLRLGEIDRKIDFDYIEDTDGHLLGNESNIRDHANGCIRDFQERYEEGLDEK
ncbi:hypothetical protein [Nocardiopsis metallicus]|uniref:Uncharacterized protein n=1 Tax=Nocardiopsis metallicus TaxID=179819 RepID=A0A840WJ13_9ACTN|nr:hypothetical protein [Nocardiopsis metallicus]MBB5492981.1 hypothetical protein [Nocardiopsis metallicus]